MADVAALKAEPRQAGAKGAVRALRRDGRVPAIVYGRARAPVAISIDGKALHREYARGGFFSRLYDLALDGDKVRVLAREVQLHPVSDAPLHVDFLHLTAETEVTVDVRVAFRNEEASPGLKRGGVLNVVRHTVALQCRADSIPELIEIDLAGLDIGDSVHISAVSLAEAVRPVISDRDFTIATIAAPTVMIEEEAEEEAEGEEGEEGVAAEGEEGAVPEGEATPDAGGDN